jgi:hypothetical protein
MEQEVDNRIYNVVVDHEEQYSTWPADKDPGRLARGRKVRSETGVPQSHRNGLDGHAPAEPAEEDGSCRPVTAASTPWIARARPCGPSALCFICFSYAGAARAFSTAGIRGFPPSWRSARFNFRAERVRQRCGCAGGSAGGRP